MCLKFLGPERLKSKRAKNQTSKSSDFCVIRMFGFQTFTVGTIYIFGCFQFSRIRKEGGRSTGILPWLCKITSLFNTTKDV